MKQNLPLNKKGLWVRASCTSGQKSWDTANGGAFTRAWLKRQARSLPSAEECKACGSLDEMDRARFGSFHKRNFDELDRARFGSFHKRNFDEIDKVGFGAFNRYFK